jgi:hypothetical protein
VAAVTPENRTFDSAGLLRLLDAPVVALPADELLAAPIGLSDHGSAPD